MWICAMFMDLSKTFDTVHHDLMIAQVKGIWFFKECYLVNESYFTYRKQEVLVNINFSTSENVIARVLLGSILGPLLFNIFINDHFLFVSNSLLSNYVSDNTIHAFGYNLEEIRIILHFDFDLVSKLLEEDHMALNADKCHFMCLGKDTKENETFNNFMFNNRNEEKILEIYIGNKLTFKRHIKVLFKKVTQNIGAYQGY